LQDSLSGRLHRVLSQALNVNNQSWTACSIVHCSKAFTKFTRTIDTVNRSFNIPRSIAANNLDAVILSTLLALALVSGCSSDIRAVDDEISQMDDPVVSTVAEFSLELSTQPVVVREGGDFAEVDVSVLRSSGSDMPITLSATGATPNDENGLLIRFDDANLGGRESETTLRIQMAIGPRSQLAHNRTLIITGSDGINEASTAWTFEVEPTSAPDVYLIVGQSNAVGFSEDDSKMALPGEPDEPFDNILQLNVTGNDSSNFAEAEDFSLAPSLYNIGEPLTRAVDPLHTGFNSSINGKEGQRIGFGLSFAKSAALSTNNDIYLVPAAWSDTGFCSRVTNRFTGMGWNATEPTNPNLSGTLLHDRAIARTNITLSETGGILRGILWHQGEADSENASCSSSYGANLSELAESLRSNIIEDARGPAARGAQSDVPFIVGTMSKGADSRDNQLPFSATKLQVDAVHRNVSALIPNSGFVNADDLVPPAYPCGEGSCVHFGAAALREMGNRYYRELIDAIPE